MRLKNNCVTLLQVKILQNIAKSDHYDSLVFFFFVDSLNFNIFWENVTKYGVQLYDLCRDVSPRVWLLTALIIPIDITSHSITGQTA